MITSLKQRIFTTFLISSIVLLAMMYIVSQVIINKEFTKYIEETHLKQDQDILQYVSEVVDAKGYIDQENFAYINELSIEQGFYITIYDDTNKVLWTNEDPETIDVYHKLVHDFEVDDNLIYKIEVSRTHEYFFSPEDLRFQRSLYIGMLFAVLVAVLIAATYSLVLSGQLSSPIVEIKNAALRLEEGKFKTRVKLQSGTRELQALTESINLLGETLERQENLRKRLTSDVSHELRTPLNVLQSYLEALIDGIREPNDENLKSCHSEVLRLTDIVKELEKLTELDNKTIVLNKSNISLNKLLRQVVQQFLPKYEAKNLTLELKEEQEVFLYADDSKLKQVIINLLSNSYKYTPSGGRVEILLTKESDSVIIKVKDNGIGISKEDIPNIFERFYRSEPSRSRRTGGAGLGLSISDSIIRAHGGTISVESIENSITEFTITL